MATGPNGFFTNQASFPPKLPSQRAWIRRPNYSSKRDRKLRAIRILTVRLTPYASRKDPPRPRRFLDAPDGEDQRPGSQVRVVPARGGLDVLVRAADRALELCPHHLGVPEEGIEILHPLE